MDFQEVRALFPITREYLYFDASSLAPYSKPVLEALNRFDAQQRDYGSAYFDKWGEEVEDCRRRIAELVGAKQSEIALTKNTSEGVNLVALLLDWKKGDNVVATNVDFPANVYPFLNLRNKGVEVKFIPGEKGITPRDVEEHIDRHTRLVTLSHVMYRDGFRLNVEEIGRICREQDVYFHVNATQSLGALELNVEKAKIDFLSAAGYKWLLSPLGSGFFFVREELLDGSPVLGWRSVKEPLAFNATEYEVADSARRFELGSLDIAAFLGMRAALELLAKIGLKKVEKRVLQLSSILSEELADLGEELLSDPKENRSGIVSIKKEATKEELLKNKVVATVVDYIRFSPHIYNDEGDIHKLIEVLKKL
ncbi:MAG: aminotransferase class V-fold PLP-dependent enzyme [Candidatus Hydrothermarchaeales archaeon]